MTQPRLVYRALLLLPFTMHAHCAMGFSESVFTAPIYRTGCVDFRPHFCLLAFCALAFGVSVLLSELRTC
jgi:hypothetical protein